MTDSEDKTIDREPRCGECGRTFKSATNMWDVLKSMIFLVAVVWIVQFVNANKFDGDELIRGGQTMVGIAGAFGYHWWKDRKRE